MKLRATITLIGLVLIVGLAVAFSGPGVDVDDDDAVTDPTSVTTTNVTPSDPPFDPADIGAGPFGEIDRVLTVSHMPPDRSGGDEAATSASSPGLLSFSSIQAAVDQAEELRGLGLGVEVRVHPGVYREAVRVGPAGGSDNPLVITGVGDVVLSGADLWVDWRPVAGGLWVHEWPFDWGVAAGDGQQFDPIVGRREIVSIAGNRLEQVIGASELQPGTFYVDEEADQLVLNPPTGVDPMAANVEVSVRPTLLTLDGASGVKVEGFEFSMAATMFNETAVEIFNSTDVVFSGNSILENSWTGLGIATSENLTVERNVVVENGGGGMTIYLSPSLLLDGNDTSMNNWRGVRGSYIGWSIGGVKMVGQHETIVRDHRSVDNSTRGFWLDYDVRAVLIENSRFCGNETDGLMIEAAPGPVIVREVEICDNLRNGLLIVDSIDVEVTGSSVLGNGASAIRLDSEPSGRVLELDDLQIPLPASENLRLADNVIGGSNELLLVNFDLDKWRLALESLNSDNNRWIATDPDLAFVTPGGSGSLSVWQAATGQDQASTFES